MSTSIMLLALSTGVGLLALIVFTSLRGESARLRARRDAELSQRAASPGSAGASSPERLAAVESVAKGDGAG